MWCASQVNIQQQGLCCGPSCAQELDFGPARISGIPRPRCDSLTLKALRLLCCACCAADCMLHLAIHATGRKPCHVCSRSCQTMVIFHNLYNAGSCFAVLSFACCGIASCVPKYSACMFNHALNPSHTLYFFSLCCRLRAWPFFSNFRQFFGTCCALCLQMYFTHRSLSKLASRVWTVPYPSCTTCITQYPYPTSPSLWPSSPPC